MTLHQSFDDPLLAKEFYLAKLTLPSILLFLGNPLKLLALLQQLLKLLQVSNVIRLGGSCDRIKGLELSVLLPLGEMKAIIVRNLAVDLCYEFCFLIFAVENFLCLTFLCRVVIFAF